MSDPPSNTPADDADKIRLKRLERLAAMELRAQTALASTSGSSSPTAAASSSSPTTTPPTISAKPTPPTAPPSRPTVSGSTPVASGSRTTTPAIAVLKKPSSLASSSSTPPARTTTPAKAATTVKKVPTKPFKTWKSETVENVFNVTLDRDRAEAADWSVVWLKEMSEEVQLENSGSTLLDPSMTDILLITRLSLDPNFMSDDVDFLQVIASLPTTQTVFEYLVGCYKRLYTCRNSAINEGYSAEEQKDWAEGWAEMKSGIVGYLGETLKDNGMFPQPSDKPLGTVEIVPPLLAIANGPLESHPIPSPVLNNLPITPIMTDLYAKFADDGFAIEILSPIVSVTLQAFWKTQPPLNIVGNEWRSYMSAISKLTEVKEIAALFPTLPIWLVHDCLPNQMEYMSLLGGLARLSVFPREFNPITQEFFPIPEDPKKLRDRAEVDSAKANLGNILYGHQQQLFTIFDNIVRSSPAAREGILNFFAEAIKKNVKRSGMRVDKNTVSSDGFMTNLEVVLLRFFQPVMNGGYDKIDRIDAEYFKKSKRIDISEDTKLRATKEEADKWLAEPPSTSVQASFVTDLFFLTCALHHVGIAKTINNRLDLEKKIHEYQRQLKDIERDPSWRGNPATLAQGEAMIKKLNGNIATSHAQINTFDAQLLDPDLTQRISSFSSYVMTWFVKLVDPDKQYPKKMISLPLPKEAPAAFKMLPEYILEDIAEYYLFLIQYKPQAFETINQDELITFVLTFLSGEYVNSPFLKSKLVKIIAMGCQPWGYFRNGILGNNLSFHALAVSQLIPCLIGYYIDMEATGGHQQFYDKFNMRADAMTIFEQVWKNPIHTDAFSKDARDNRDRFVIFANMHMNDTTYLLGESLSELAQIYTIQTEKKDAAFWNSLTDVEKQDKESKLKAAENQARYATSFAKRNVAQLRDFTAAAREPFMQSEIVDRLAAMLTYNLDTLAGPKMQDLKVEDPKKYEFDPRTLLGDLSDIFRNLGVEQRFVEAVAREGRSYKKETFETLAKILQHRAVKTQSEIEQLIDFCKRVEDTRQKIEAEEEGDDVPDEFLDPLMYTIMRDPVILPGSKMTIDRSTIKSHLLSDPTDPFNRMPLKIEECKPDTELLAKIQAWRDERRLNIPKTVELEKMEIDSQ